MCMASKFDFDDLSKKYKIHTSEFVSQLYQQAKDLEESRSIKDADDFLQKYDQIYLEVYYLELLFKTLILALNIDYKTLFLYRTSSQIF